LIAVLALANFLIGNILALGRGIHRLFPER